MIQLRFDVTVTKVDLTTIWPALKTQAQECATEVKQSEDAVVANWKNKPTFTIQARETDLHAEYEIVPTGSNVPQWRAVSRGARGTTIKPVKAPALAFPYQGPGKSYVPKTAPGLFYGGPGVKVGPVQRFQQVFWPGIEPRHFEESMMRKYLPTFISKMNGALSRAHVR